MNTPPFLRQIVPEVKIDLPKNWQQMKAKDVFRGPIYLKLDQQAERYIQAQPELRFPELLEADKAAHVSFYQNNKRAPLPESWEKYGRSFKDWWVRGYDVEWTPPPEQDTPEERIYYERTCQYVEEQRRRELDDEKKTGGANPSSPPKASSKQLDRAEIISRNSLVEYCRKHGLELKQEGPRFKCLCPLHQERTPSFTIGPDPSVWFCFGCSRGGSVIDLHAALRGIDIGEAMQELSPSSASKPVEVAAYVYRDKDGYPIFEVVRFWPKDFRQFRIDENGQRIWKGGMGDIQRVPYRLPEVLAADEVFVCEGEKDADVLVEQAGRVATCNPGGAGKWKPEFAEYFQGRRVYIIPDRDEPGRKHGEDVGRSLVGAAASVWWVDLPNGAKDIADFAQTNRQAFSEKLAALLKQARPFSNDWPEPKPLEDYLLPVLPMKRDMLPEPFSTWTADIANRIECPLDFVAATSVVMASSLLGTRVRVHPKQDDHSWEISPHLWGGVIGAPGTRKTPSTSAILKALKRLQADSDQAFKEAIDRYVAQAADHADEVKATRTALGSLRRKKLNGKADEGDEQREQELKEQLAELEKTKPKQPSERWFYVNDPTVAALQQNLAPNSTCVLIERDELVGLLTSWEIEGHQSDRAFYLEAWTGLGPYKGMRITRGNFFIANLCLALFGGIQPVKLIHYLRDPEINLQHDGMIQRFQVLVFPDPVKDLFFVDREENVDAKNRCYAILKKLATADYHRDFGAIYGDDFRKVPYFQFDEEAQDRFRTWYLANQAKASDRSEDPVMQEHLSKFSQLVASLATIFHVIDLADTDSKSTYIPIQHLEKALQWAEYLESHARRVYALAKNPSLSAAFILADKLTDPRTELGDWPHAGFTARDLTRKAWAGLDDRALIDSGLARLEECNWIRSEEIEPAAKGGRPTIRYKINPLILSRRTAKR